MATPSYLICSRIDAINILIKAAQELSWFGFEEEAAQRKPLIQEVPKVLLTKQAAKQEVLVFRYCSKINRLSSGLSPTQDVGLVD